MNSRTKRLIAGLSFAGLLDGCAAVAPAQLVEARTAFTASSNGLAGTLTPTELHDAKRVLDQATQEFDAHGDTLVMRDYAYLAKRKVDLADVIARTMMDRRAIADATKEGVAARDDQVMDTRAALAETREQLVEERTANTIASAELRAANSVQGAQLARTTAQLKGESEAAQARFGAAMRDLVTIASVKEEARGLVITLTGTELFASGDFTLRDSARSTLNQVADALKGQSVEKSMLVEGHTDSRGSEALNLPLARGRAGAVRDYLISRGVDASRVTAVGLGSSRPLLDNKTAANRANNRRVEIVIRPSPLSAR